jgi:dGTPase
MAPSLLQAAAVKNAQQEFEFPLDPAPKPKREKIPRKTKKAPEIEIQPELDFEDIAARIRSRNREIEELIYSPYATRNQEAFRLMPEPRDIMRTEYERDRHRIIFSKAYRGYRGRTQVFALSGYQLSDRMVHVQYVVQISRMIAKALGLNTDLTEAIALGHDLGHAPFGHDGERCLSQICREAGIGAFHHNIQSLRIVDRIERSGRGLNLTWQTRDGILSHDGEVHNIQLQPERDKDEEHLERYIRACSGTSAEVPAMRPATLEGCVMRISDTIAYIGSDIEDAIRVGMITPADLPPVCREYLGITNGQIIETVVKDVIGNSIDQDYICFSQSVSEALISLKKWNYQNIYLKFKRPEDSLSRRWSREIEKMNRGLHHMFETFCADISAGNEDSAVFREFLNHMSDEYRLDKANTPPIIARDFIASLTDSDAQRLVHEMSVPTPLFLDLKRG